MNNNLKRKAFGLGLALAFVFSGVPARTQIRPAMESGQEIQPRAVIPGGNTFGIAFSPDGKAVWLTQGSKASLWDLSSGGSKMTLAYNSSDRPDWHMEGIYSLALSPDGKTMASGAQNGELKFWDPETGKVKTSANLASGQIQSVAWSPDGSTVAAGQSFTSSLVKLVDPASGEIKATLEVSKYTGKGILAYSPDGKFLAVSGGGAPSKVRLYDAKTGVLKKTLEISQNDERNYPQGVGRFAFSPDSKTLATGGAHSGYLLDVATGRVRARLLHEEKEVLAVAYSPDGKLVATASDDGTAKIWDAATGKIRATLMGQYTFHMVAFSPDGKTIVVGSSDSTKLYDAPGK